MAGVVGLRRPCVLPLFIKLDPAQFPEIPVIGIEPA